MVNYILVNSTDIGESGCAHAQQLIWQLFNTIEKGFQAAGDTDTAFLEGMITDFVRCDI